MITNLESLKPDQREAVDQLIGYAKAESGFVSTDLGDGVMATAWQSAGQTRWRLRINGTSYATGFDDAALMSIGLGWPAQC